jgi:predicted HicB family RNase H-like nuclease
MTSGRARADEYARRVNEAIELMEEGRAATEVSSELARRHGVSVRQGWRYVHEATERSEPLMVPEPKLVFTVKLPKSLVELVRAAAATQGRTLSALVSEALEQMLWRLQTGRRGGGPEEKG